MTKSNKKTTFTQKEVAAQINNAVIQSLRPAILGEIPESRMWKLRAYSQGLAAPVLNHIDEEFLRPEEAVFVFLSAALFVQCSRIMRTDKLPMGPLVKNQFEGTEAVEIPLEYYQTPDPTEEEILPALPHKKKGRK